MPLSRHARRLLLAGSLTFLPGAVAQVQRASGNSPQSNPANPEVSAKPVPPEKNSATPHEFVLGGKTIRYTATAGNLLINGDDDQPNASVF